MRCLSVQQPWAALIAAGLKDVEHRDWSTRHRGPLAIHAGISRSCWASLGDEARARVPLPPGISGDLDRLPHGQVVAVCELVDVRPLDELVSRDWGEPPAKWGWVLEDIRPLAEPVPVRGAQGLFHLPRHVDLEETP